jgi:hypothetical protein
VQRLHACRQRGMFLGHVTFVLFEPVEEALDKKKRPSLSGQVFAHKATARRKVFLLDKYANPFAQQGGPPCGFLDSKPQLQTKWIIE